MSYLPKCGMCGLPIKKYDSVRHFGFFIAHQDYECIALLRARIEELEKELKAKQKEEAA